MSNFRLALVAFAVLAAAAALGADADRAPVTAALENAPSQAAAAPGATPESSAQTPTPRGNPLWGIPLRTLSATRDRPLFSASRRPPAPVIAAAPAPAPAPTPVVVKAGAPERPPATLVGTIVSPEERIAIFVDDATKAVSRLHEGDEFSGWRVRVVLPRSTVVEKGDQSITLGLPKPGDDQPPGEMPAEMPLPVVNDGAL